MRAVLRTSLFSTIAFTLSLFLASCGSISNPMANSTSGNSASGPVPSVTAQAVEVNGVAPNRKQEVQFSEAMNPDTVNAKTFLVTDAGGNQVSGTVTYDSDYNVAMFQPAPALEDNTQYTGTITTGAQSVGGRSLAANYSWTFTTRADTDSSPLTVTNVVPTANAQCVSPTTTITITFNEAPDASTVTTANIVVTDSTGNTVPVSLSTTISTPQVVLTPKSALPSGNITVTVSNIGDLADVMMQQPYKWTFSTACNTGGGGGGAAAAFTTLHTFENSDGANPQAALIQDSAGNLYSTTEYGGSYQMGAAFELTPSAVFSVLHNFGYPSTDGSRPQSPLLADGQGNFYGTAYVGGNYCEGQFQCGTVFKIDNSSNETTVYAFGSSSSNDGANPVAGLIADAAGNLYGTTWGGNNGSIAYQVTPSGTETILHQFTGGTDGLRLYGPLVMDDSGNLWGTTYAGGGTGCGGQGCGTIFRLTKGSSGWTETITYRFSGGGDGANPYAGLTWDRNRQVFYGVTEFGGTASGCAADTNGCGVLFQVDATGTTETILHNFSGQSDGGQPVANLVLDAHGNLWGTTTIGGDTSCPANSHGCGTVFSVAPGASLLTVHTFTGGADGAVPYGALLFDAHKPVLYGTTTVGGDPKCQTQEGGGPGCGIVYQITP